MKVLIFGVIPILSVVILFIVNRKILVVAPLISVSLAFIAYTIALAPISIVEKLGTKEWRMFFVLDILMKNFSIALFLTVIVSFVAYIIKRKRK